MYNTSDPKCESSRQKAWRRLTAALVLLLALVCGFVAGAQNGPPELSQNQLALLYSSRITFDADGVPQVAIGLMTGKDSLRVDCSRGCRFERFNHDIQVVRIADPAPLVIRRVEGKAGKTQFGVVAEALDHPEKDLLASRIAYWKTQGVTVSPTRVGAVVALGATVLDNSRYLLVDSYHDNEADAKKRLAAMVDAHGIGPFLFARMQSLPDATIEVQNSSGQSLLTSRRLLNIQASDGGDLTVPDCEYGQGFYDQGRADLAFGGTLIVAADREGKLALANRQSIEEILKGTVPAEMFSSAPLEALKAQAVAARGQLIGKLGNRHLADPFQLCATQHCQVYRGRRSQKPATDQAVETTRGQFLVADGRLIDTTYSASAGGFSCANETAWSQSPDPHRRARLDGPADTRFANGITEANLDAFLDAPPASFSAQAGYNLNYFRWQREIDAATLSARINAQHAIGKLTDLKPLSRGRSGRLIALQLVGTKGTVTIHREWPIRKLLGGLPSALIRITTYRNPDGSPLRFVFDGAGFGHGVGMCQTGAIGRAKAGQTHARILGFYYSGAELLKLY